MLVTYHSWLAQCLYPGVLPSVFGHSFGATDMHTLSLTAAAAVCLVCSGSAQAGPPFPSRQITIVVPFAAGGPSDAMARLVAQGLGEQIGPRVIVDNLAGARGTI